VIGEMSSLEPEFKKMTRSMTSKNPNLDNPSPEFQMKLYIDIDDEIEGGSSAIADVLVNLKKNYLHVSPDPVHLHRILQDWVVPR
jgi:hypothetical protein